MTAAAASDMINFEEAMNQFLVSPARQPDLTIPTQGRGSAFMRVILSNEFGLTVLIAITFLLFASLLPGFASKFSLFTMGRQIGIDTMIGLAMMAVIVTGGLDLSVGAIGVCAAMIFGYLSQVMGVPLAVAIPSPWHLVPHLGFVNGATVVRTGVHSFHHHARQYEHFLWCDDLSDQGAGLQSVATHCA